MDPRFLSGLLILPGLAACPVSQHQATLRSLTVPPPPTHEWPYIPERPQPDHPAHGEGSGELPFSVGIAASGTNTNVAAQTVWFHNDFTPISPEFFAERYVVQPSPASNSGNSRCVSNQEASESRDATSHNWFAERSLIGSLDRRERKL